MPRAYLGLGQIVDLRGYPHFNTRSSRIFSLAGLSPAPSAPEPAAEQGDASLQEAVALAQERAKATAKSQCALLEMFGGDAATAGTRRPASPLLHHRCIVRPCTAQVCLSSV